MAWIYKGKEIKEIPEGYIGFIYLIEDAYGKIYIGKKQFTHKTKSRISKREIKATKTRKRVKVTLKDSGWLNYQSSCLPLQQAIKENGVENFTFEILALCKDKRELSYLEVKYQFKYNVLEVDSYNGNILGRFFKPK